MRHVNEVKEKARSVARELILFAAFESARVKLAYDAISVS